jgi:flagellar hook-length control protein FliK
VTTTTETIVAATVTAVATTDDKTESTATEDATTDVGSATDATQTSPSTTAPQPSTSSATPTVVAGNPTQTNSSTGNATNGPDQDNSIGNGIDRVRFVQRVARAFQSVGSSGGSIRLRLSPPELGSVKLEVSVKNGVLTAHAQTETAAARDALVDNLPALRERLAEQNIQVDQFDVDLFDASAGGTPNQSQGNGDSPQGFAPASSRSTSKSPSGMTAVAAATDQATGIVNGGLNVVI